MIFILPFTINHNQAHAFVSKIGSAAAKKAAKEVIKDSAVQMAIDIVFNYEMNDIMKNGYKVSDESYKPVCLEKQGDKCIKPAQVKVPSTKAEKKVLADKVEQVLERKTNTSRGWQKFLDWFVPIFLVTGVVGWIESKFDSETEDLFDEVAKESLEEIGYIKSLYPEVPPQVIDSETGQPKSQPQIIPESEIPNHVFNNEPVTYEYDLSNLSSRVTKTISVPSSSMGVTGSAIVIDFSSNVQHAMLNKIDLSANITNLMIDHENTFTSLHRGYDLNDRDLGLLRRQMYGIVKGEVVPLDPYATAAAKIRTIVEKSGLTTTQMYNPTRVIIENVYIQGKGYVTKLYWIASGQIIVLESIAVPKINPDANQGWKAQLTFNTSVGISQKAKVTFYPDKTVIDNTPYLPQLKDLNDLSIDNSIYKQDGDGNYIIPSPSVVPIKKPDGTYVKPDGNGGWIDAETGQPIQVDEDTLIAEDIQTTPEDDSIIAPDGSTLPKPQPKPNPTDPNAPPGTDEEPDAEKDKKKLEDKSREWGPLLTTKFPFSLPWDFAHLMGLLFADPKTPKWEIKGTEKIPIDMEIDLGFLDPYIVFFRGFVFFSFVGSVIFMHSRFMGGSK